MDGAFLLSWLLTRMKIDLNFELSSSPLAGVPWRSSWRAQVSSSDLLVNVECSGPLFRPSG